MRSNPAHWTTVFAPRIQSSVACVVLSLAAVEEAKSDTIDDLVAQVSQVRIAGHIQALEAIGPRDTPASQAQASAYIAAQLSAFGYNVVLDPVSGSENVIARLQGTVNPQRLFVVGAHFDTVANSPGADDNASGVAGMLEIARVLSGARVGSSIEFVAFAHEELRGLGSAQYAQLARSAGQEIVGMISLEMIAYTCTTPGCQTPFSSFPGCLTVDRQGITVGDYIANVGNAASSGLIHRFNAAAERYVPALEIVSAEVAGTGTCFPATRRSDHSSFWDQGYPAIMLSDTANFRNPNYHQATDTFATLDMTFAHRVTQATLAMVVNGQPNSTGASLQVNGQGIGDANGPFAVTIPSAGGSVALDWNGPAGVPFALLIGEPNPSNFDLGCLGLLDIGTPPAYLDLFVPLSGVLDSNGFAQQSFITPPHPVGPVVSVQGAVMQLSPGACDVVLTAAFYLRSE